MQKPSTDNRIFDEIRFGIAGYLAVLVAYELRLFPFLASEPRSLAEVSEKLGISARPAEALLGVCTSLGLVQAQDHRYALTAVARDYLLETSPIYFGGILDMVIANSSTFYSFESVRKAVLTNSPQLYGGGDMFETHKEQANRARAFTRAMHSFSMAPALVWPDVLDLATCRLMLDVGGGSGAHSIGAARKWPNLKAVVLDLAPACEVAKELIAQSGLQNRITTQVGDLWEGPFPPADLHFYSLIFHDFPSEKCRFLCRKSFQSLPSGGRIVLHEMLLNDEKTGPFAVAAYSVFMLLATYGQQYSGPELVEMLAEAGFAQIEVKPTFGHWSIVTGVKP